MVSKPILWIAELVGGDKLRVENGTRSYAAGAGAGVSSSLTFDELGSDTSASGCAASDSDSTPAVADALEDLFRFFVALLPSGLGGFDTDTADMMTIVSFDLRLEDLTRPFTARVGET
jgi:hypothetical protein